MALFVNTPLVVGSSVASPVYTLDNPGVLMSIVLTNTHYGSLPVTAWIMRGATRIEIVTNKNVPLNQQIEILASKMALEDNDQLFITCPVDGKLKGLTTIYKDVV